MPAGCTPTPEGERGLARLSAGTVRLTATAEPDRAREIRTALAGIVPAISTDRPDEVAVSSRRLDDGGTVSLVVNTGREAAVRIRSTDPGCEIEAWDVAAGARRAAARSGELSVRLAPYEAVVVSGERSTGRAAAEEAEEESSAVALAGWTVAGAGPVSLPHAWEDDPAVPEDAERLVYEARFVLDGRSRLVLDLGATEPFGARRDAAGLRGSSFEVPLRPPVGAAALVSVDGAPVARIWRAPFRAELGEIGGGEHVLRIEVRSVGVRATAARAVDGSDAGAAAAHGVRHRVQDATRRAEGVRSGLLGVPVLRARPA